MSEDMTLGARSANLTVSSSSDTYRVLTEEYAIWVDSTTNFVEYQIRPYFTSDYICYQRADPEYSGDGTVDQYGNDADQVNLVITDWGTEGSAVWFLESCAEFSVKQSFNIYRDYFELNVTYAPGTKKVITTYYMALCSSSGSIYNLMNGRVNRYVPGMPELANSDHSIGGWYPSFLMYAPACDMRAPLRSLGWEFGFEDTVAYLSSPLWLSSNRGGSSVFAVKYFAYNSVVPNLALNEPETFHIFCRPYKYTDGKDRGYDVGYAQWVAPLIAANYGSHNRATFPLTVMNLAKWSSSFRTWVENSQVKLATYTENPNQFDWNYKSSQMANYEPDTASDVPTSWQIYSAPGTPLTWSDGSVVCNPVSGPATQSGTFRWHLIYNDDYQDWWTSTDAVFWDEINMWSADNRLRNDYQMRSDFIYDGYLRLIDESLDSGFWDLAIANSFSALLHLSIVADLCVIEGYEASSSYNIDMKAHVWSTMNFVNNIPVKYRPTILVYQNYATGSSSDQLDVYSAIFGAAKYGYHLDLLSYDSYDSQMHNFRMAEDMFKAMGCTRDSDTRTVSVSTLDLAESSSITTSASMLVMTGPGTASILCTSSVDKFKLTNLRSTATQFNLGLTTTNLFQEGSNVQSISPMTFTADGKGTFHGTITAEKTGEVIRNPNVLVVQHNTGSTSVGMVSMSPQEAKFNIASTGGSATITLKGMQPNTAFDITVDSAEVATMSSLGDGTLSFERSYGSSDVLQIDISDGALPDNVPPTVTSCIPANGANGVGIGTSVTLGFSEDMDKASVEASFSLTTDGSSVVGAFTWPSASSLIFTPSAQLSYSRTYVIGLTASAEDLADNHLASPFSSQFTTADNPTPPPPDPVPPSSPTNLVAYGGVRLISLYWDEPTDDGGAAINGYRVYRSSTPTGTFTLLANLGTTDRYDDRNLGNGETYYYRVSAFNGAGEGGLSTSVSAQTQRLPSAPVSLSASPSLGSVKLTWSPPVNDGGSSITAFIIYRGASPGQEAYLATVGNVMTYADNLVQNGKTYYYMIAAVNLVGSGPSSNEASAMPGELPSAPQFLVGTPGDAHVLLTWEPPIAGGGMAISSYNVYRGEQQGDMTRIASVDATSYLDAGLINGYHYYYSVSAVNAAGEGLRSVITSAKPLTVPSAPLNLTAVGGNTQILLTWQAPATDGGDAISGYNIYRSNMHDGWVLIAYVQSGLEYLDSGLENGASYLYLLRAVNGAGWSPTSNEAYATTTTLPPSTPTQLTAIAGKNSVALQWQPPIDQGSGAVQAYNVYRGTDPERLSQVATIADSLEYLDQGLVNGQQYWYAVSAANEFMEGMASHAGPIVPIWLPGSPGDVEATVEGPVAHISWTAPDEDNGSSILRYSVYEWIGEEWTLTARLEPSTNYLIVRNLAPASTHLYQVRAENSVGEGPGGMVEFEVADLPSEPRIATISQGVQNVTLSWHAPSDDGGTAISAYVVYRSEGGAAFRIAAIVPASVRHMLDEGLKANVTYRYYIAAMNAMGSGPTSNIAQATALPPFDPDAGQSTTTKNWAGTYQGVLTLSSVATVGLLCSMMLYYIYRRNSSKGIVEWLKRLRK
jgi:fibronectin type 3 domain-containing protein